jgi:hypothetical protein
VYAARSDGHSPPAISVNVSFGILHVGRLERGF